MILLYKKHNSVDIFAILETKTQNVRIKTLLNF